MILKHLQYLIALAEHAHFGRAAEACHVSQPTLSMALKQMEDELGVVLIERGHRFTRLTPEGEVVLTHARRMIAEGDEMRQAIAEFKGGVGGRLRLGAIPTALPMIARITRPFTTRYPAVTLTITSMTSDDVVRGVRAFDLDVGVTYLDGDALDGLVTKPVYQEAYVVMVGAEDPLAALPAVPWRLAARAKLALLTPDMQNRRIIDGIFRAIGAAPQPAMETNSIFNLCTHAGVQGLASIVPRQLLNVFGVPAGVVALPLIEPDERRSVGLVAANRHPQAPLTRHLLATTDPLAD